MRGLIRSLKYWLDMHTMNPFAWPYVLMESAHHKLEDALAQKDSQDDITTTNVVCPQCGHDVFTEQGLCENCGKAVIEYVIYGP